jgi:hypothetical protein
LNTHSIEEVQLMPEIEVLFISGSLHRPQWQPNPGQNQANPPLQPPTISHITQLMFSLRHLTLANPISPLLLISKLMKQGRLLLGRGHSGRKIGKQPNSRQHPANSPV